MNAPVKIERFYEDLSPRIRDITKEEIEHFVEHGWVHARNFIDPALCEEVIKHFQDWCGLRWKEWPSDPAEQKAFMDAVKNMEGRTKHLFAIRQDDPWMFNFVTQRKFGEAAAKFLKLPAVKIFSETLHVKFPKSSGKSRALAWHQDWPSIPIDRAGAMQMWLALVPVTPDMGPMTHLSGSHREQPGGMVAVAGEDAHELYPELFTKYKASEPPTMAQGDAHFHHTLTWHASGENKSDKVRWGMSSIRFDARARYTGQHNFNSDGMGLVPNQPFNHPHFPTVYP